MAHAHKGKKKISKATVAVLKAPKKVEKTVKTAVKHVNKTHWDDKGAFATAIEKSGVNPDVINLNAEWDLYQSDKDGYRNHLKLKK